MVLVDSCIWIEAGRKNGDLGVKVALEGLLDEYEATFCGPVKLEVLGAARKEERKALTFFFGVIPYVSMDDAIWEKAKEISWRLKDRGVNVPWNDMLIAAIAIKQECRIYTIDQHFEAIGKHCGIALYRPSYGGSYDPGVE